MGAAPLKPMAQRPGMKPSNRAQEDADEERYWQKRKNARREAPGGGARDAQRSREAEFFTKCRQRMPKPLYLELLKCLNLFSFKILERSELLTLAHDLFKRSQPDLYQVFRSLLPGYAGGDNRALDDGGDDGRAARPPMADAAHYRELDFSAMKKHGTSYRILPDDYQKPTCSGRGPLEQLVLNDSWVSVASGSEDLNFKQMRKNQYEEAIFRAEDERFELDTSIDTNMACLNALLPVQAELATKPESEKRRLRLEHLMPEKQGLSAMHMRAIKRLYGAQGAQVIALLAEVPGGGDQPAGEAAAAEGHRVARAANLARQGVEGGVREELHEGARPPLLLLQAGRQEELRRASRWSSSSRPSPTPRPAEKKTEKRRRRAARRRRRRRAPARSRCRSRSRLVGAAVEAPRRALALFVFAAKLIFSQIGEEDVETKIQSFWGDFVLKFFACADVDAAAGAAGAAAMEVDGAAPRAKPVVVVSADAAEEGATREGRPPEQRWSHPLAYAKTSALFVGSSHFYIFARLYHVIIERLAAAKEMAAKSEELATQQEAKGGEAAGERTPGGSPHGAAADENGVDGDGEKSERCRARRSRLDVKKEHGGDLYAAFTSCLKQVVEGKMEPSVYEDLLRTLLGTNDVHPLHAEQDPPRRAQAAPGAARRGHGAEAARPVQLRADARRAGDDVARDAPQQRADDPRGRRRLPDRAAVRRRRRPPMQPPAREGGGGGGGRGRRGRGGGDDDDDAVDAGEKGEWARVDMAVRPRGGGGGGGRGARARCSSRAARAHAQARVGGRRCARRGSRAAAPSSSRASCDSSRAPRTSGTPTRRAAGASAARSATLAAARRAPRRLRCRSSRATPTRTRTAGSRPATPVAAAEDAQAEGARARLARPGHRGRPGAGRRRRPRVKILRPQARSAAAREVRGQRATARWLAPDVALHIHTSRAASRSAAPTASSSRRARAGARPSCCRQFRGARRSASCLRRWLRRRARPGKRAPPPEAASATARAFARLRARASAAAHRRARRREQPRRTTRHCRPSCARWRTRSAPVRRCARCASRQARGSPRARSTSTPAPRRFTAPWFLVENYLYKRVLELTDAPSGGADPFAAQKAEIARGVGRRLRQDGAARSPRRPSSPPLA